MHKKLTYLENNMEKSAMSKIYRGSKSFSKNSLKKISNSLSSEQKRFDIELSGGDTVYSKTSSFTCCVIGFSNTFII